MSSSRQRYSSIPRDGNKNFTRLGINISIVFIIISLIVSRPSELQSEVRSVDHQIRSSTLQNIANQVSQSPVWLVNTSQFLILIGWHNTRLDCDWLTQNNSWFWLVREKSTWLWLVDTRRNLERLHLSSVVPVNTQTDIVDGNIVSSTQYSQYAARMSRW